MFSVDVAVAVAGFAFVYDVILSGVELGCDQCDCEKECD
jgi:hypothetical protein